MFALRPYQEDAVEALFRDLETHPSALAVLPTGAGKTEILIDICKRQITQNPHRSVLCLSHLSLLINQTKNRFAARAPALKVSTMYKGDLAARDSDVIVSTMQTTRLLDSIRYLNSALKNPIGLLIIDECHLLPTTSYQQILAAFPDVQLVGLTATPFRDSRIMTNAFATLSFSLSVQDLIDQGYLCPPRLLQITRKGDDLPEVLATVLHIYDTYERGKKCIVFLRTVEECRALKTAFHELQVTCEPITGKLPPARRDELLHAFSFGQVDVLATVNVLSQGFDAPVIESIIMPYGTSSPTNYLQRIGRGLRLCPEINKKECRVYVFGNAPSISSRLYEKLERQALTTGGAPREYPTHREDLDFNDYDRSSDIYTWNKLIVDTIDKMERLAMPNLAALLNEKRFPKKFLQNLPALEAALPSKKSSLPHGDKPATDSQKTTLFRLGFHSSTLDNLTKREASTMIATIFSLQNKKTTEFVVQSGTHHGKHVSELPHAYRDHVKKNFPNSEVSKIIVEWEKRRTS
jgi:superfamily II DNA or RNA helicase